MGHIFISYARQDAAFTMELENRLLAGGFRVWKDTSRLDAGTEWASGIDAAVDACDVLILVVTRASMESQYVTYEWAHALSCSTPVLPILLEDARLHPRLAAIQRVDFTKQHCWEKLLVEVGAARTRKSDVPPVVRAAIAFLDDPVPERQLEGVRHLEKLDHPSARAALVKALSHPNHEVCRLALLTLGQMTAPEAEEALLRAVQDESYPCRPHALWALSELPQPGPAQDLFRRFVVSERYFERAAALRGLKHHQDPADIPTFLRALDDESDYVRYYACDGLKAFGNKALPQLLSASNGPLTPRMQHALITVLGRLGDDRALPFLASSLSSDDETPWCLACIHVSHKEEFCYGGGLESIGVAAMQALQSIGTPAAHKAIAAYQKGRVNSSC